MTKFETLFGVKESEIKDTCVLMPLAPKGALNEFGVKGLARGKIYSSANTPSFTLINTGMGAAFTGDAVIYLSDTNCKNIILFGSCGLVKSSDGLDIGSLVMPIECLSMESFTDMLLKKRGFETFYPDKDMVESFLNNNKGIRKVNCATLGSLKLEEENLGLFAEKNIQVVDMECSCLFSAARDKHLKTMALFYISDVINEKPFYEKLSPEDEIRISGSIKSAIRSICGFVK
jgi:purine-nucleoside phosphorylase